MAMDSSQRHERAWTGTDPPDRYGQGVHELIAWCGFLGAWLLCPPGRSTRQRWSLAAVCWTTPSGHCLCRWRD